jgi:hypothetical protein
MKTEDRIIKYLEDELTAEERIVFETDLNNSSQLREEFEKFLRVKKETLYLKEMDLKQYYLDSIVPEFRSNLSLPKASSVKRNLGFAFGIMLVFVISVVILQNIFNETTEFNEVQEFTESLNENQKIELLESLNGDLEDYYKISDNDTGIELTNLIQTDLKMNSEVAEAYDINYTELVDELTASEAEKIYEEILNKNFSEEVKL